MLEDKNISSVDALRSVRRLVQEALPSRWKLFAVAVICMVGVAYFTAALANATQFIVDDVFVQAEEGAALRVALLVIGIAAAKSLFSYINSIISFLFNRSISIVYQKRLFDHVLGQDLGFFASQHASRQMSILQNVGRATGRSVALVTNKLIVETLTLISLFAVMIRLDAMMTLICGVIIPLIFAVVATLSKRIRKASKQELSLAGKFYEKGTEILEGIKTVKSFQLEDKSIQRFDASLDEMEERTLQVAKISSATVPLMELLGGLVIGLFVLYGAGQALSGALTPGEITAFLAAFLMAYQPAERISKLWVDLQKEAVLVANMYAILDRPLERTRYGQGALPKGETPSIRLEDVSFSYGPETPVVRNLSFDIAPGERIAVVGRSGAGKSTLIDLLLRFQDPQDGVIAFGDIDIRSLSQEALHDAVAFVSQDVFLFDGTLADNIADGHDGLTRDEIAQAARLAQLGDVVAEHPAGIDLAVGPDGNALSGGQRQRLAIARGIAKKAKIYIFDEVTSALDAQNERAIMLMLPQALAGATLIFVTHRAATFDHVDRVLMLQNGELCGFDAPSTLLETNPAFQALFADLDSDDDTDEALYG